MNRLSLLHAPLIALAITWALSAAGLCQEPAEPLLRQLPVGIYVDASAEVPADQTAAIGRRLGGNLQRLTNSNIRVHGRPIQVNVLTAVDEQNAAAVFTSLSSMKSRPFCERKGSLVIEYVGNDIDEALALKTSYELGVLQKPTHVRYRVVADIATIDRADYMASNPLFNQLLVAQAGSNPAAVQQIQQLASRFTFGNRLALRNLAFDDETNSVTLQPPQRRQSESGAAIVYEFGELPKRYGIPFVTVTIDVTVPPAGTAASRAAPPPELTAATAFWPATDPAITQLAQQITVGKSTNDEKVDAILQWLSPGQKIRYSGQTGSRWGTKKVLEQKFGHCWDFSDCFVTLARAVGVPCRQVAGWLYGSSGHVWAEYYSGSEGWKQVDPTGGGKLPCEIYHIPYFVTDDGEMPILYAAMPKIEILDTK